MRHYWFEFVIPDDVACPRGVREGVGVTAADLADARAILVTDVFGPAIPPIRREVEDVAFYDLCPYQVLPNMADPARRGVWFPLKERRRNWARWLRIG